MATSANSCSKVLNKALYGLCVECFIAVLTLIDVLAITAELLIRLEILRLPQDDDSQSVSVTKGPTSNVTVDPGGSICSHCHFTTDNFNVTVCVFHYISIVIAGIFFIEVFCRLVTGPKYFCRHIDQILDGLIVLVLVTMEILFTVFWKEVLCYHDVVEAATYIVIFRLWRVRRACNISRDRYAEKMELTTHYLRECKVKTDEENKEYERTIKRQEIEIENLKKQILRYEIENSKSPDQSILSRESSEYHEVPNGYVPGVNRQENGEIKEQNTTKTSSTKQSVNKEGNSSCTSKENSPSRVGSNKTTINVENNSRQHTSPEKGETTAVADDNLDVKNSETVEDYEQGTGEFIPVLDNNVIITDSEDNSQNENNKKTAESKSLKKSLSEGSNLYKLQEKKESLQITKENQFNRSNSVEAGHVHEIISQIESKTKDKLRSSKIKRRNSDKDKLIMTEDDENDSALGADNIGLDIDELDEVQKRNLPVMAEYEGTRTYRSAEGIPLTDL